MKKSELQSQSDFRLSEQIQNQSILYNRPTKKQCKTNKSKKKQLTNNGSWNLDEEIMFMVFMQTNRNIFQDKPQRKKCHIFKEMSNFLTTRTAEQCRSHHQKYQVSLGSFDKIIEHIASKIQRDNNKKIKERQTLQKLKQIKEKSAYQMGMNFDWYSGSKMPQNCLSLALQQACGIQKHITRPSCLDEPNYVQMGEGFKIIQMEDSPNLNLQVLIDFDVFFRT